MNKIRILLVDDHKVVRSAFRNLLSAEPDMEVVAEASTGKEAITETLRCTPNVVLMDICMPVMNGIDATRELKRQWPALKVIGLSGQDDIYFRQALFTAGASSYVYKGAHPAELMGSIRTAVNQHS